MALAGLKAIEFAGLAPGPFAGLILADNGADVIRVDKPASSSNDILCRGKRSIAIDAKTNSGRDVLKKLISTADILIDPFRPGVLERLGLGPDVFLGNANRKGANERLIYARISGFPKTGPHKDMAGHDINYIALSGVLSMLPGTVEKPAFPVNLLADFAGGGLMCVLGILLALITRSNSGRGQVVDVDMVSGTRYLSSFPLLQTLLPNSVFPRPRGENLLDGGAPFYSIYTCKDKGLMAVGCLEPQFFEAFIKGFLGALPNGFALPDGWRPTARSQGNREEWPKLKEFLTRGFQTNTRKFWTDVFHGTDACVVPVLSPKEASEYEVFRSPYPQPHPAILGFSSVSKGTVSEALELQPGSHTEEILCELGLTGDELQRLAKDGAVENTLRCPKTRL
ncbi:CoA-transferase family III domain containing protein [Amanita muscaria]